MARLPARRRIVRRNEQRETSQSFLVGISISSPGHPTYRIYPLNSSQSGTQSLTSLLQAAAFGG